MESTCEMSLKHKKNNSVLCVSPSPRPHYNDCLPLTFVAVLFFSLSQNTAGTQRAGGCVRCFGSKVSTKWQTCRWRPVLSLSRRNNFVRVADCRGWGGAGAFCLSSLHLRSLGLNFWRLPDSPRRARRFAQSKKKFFSMTVQICVLRRWRGWETELDARGAQTGWGVVIGVKAS